MREINDLEVSIESVKGVGAKRGAVLREVGQRNLAQGDVDPVERLFLLHRLR